MPRSTDFLRRRWPLALVAAMLALAGAVWALSGPVRHGGPTGLFTTLPILWNETGSVGELVTDKTPPHWARAVLSARGPVVPLDNLARIDGLRVLLIAQPRPLSAQENVEMDCWVRAGGHLLLFADPMLTHESAYSIGDRRRPQDVVLISPLLSHWGLRLVFDEVQPLGTRSEAVWGVDLPANLPGRIELTDTKQGCSLEAKGLAAQCRIGKGRATIVADAALLERGGDVDDDARAKVLSALLDRAGGD